MAKPVTPQDMFDLWQKMVNPGAYPLQSLMFPVLDPEELRKKIAELEAVEHWLKANLTMLVEGGEKAAAAFKGEDGAPPPPPNPAMWAWNMMAQAGRSAAQPAEPPKPTPAKRKKKT
jgi:hypothetical protein